MNATFATHPAFESFTKVGQEQTEKLRAQLLAGYEEFIKLARLNTEALMKSSSIITEGSAEIGKSLAALAKTTTEKNIAIGKAILSAKTLPEVINLQKGYVESTVESLVTESQKLTKLSAKVANEAIQPLAARATTVADTVKKKIAA